MPHVYDCFTFKNELLLLDLRLHELSDAVDFFVLVEGTRSFTNRPKPLYFLENRDRFQQFSERIIHIIVDDFPPYRGDRWAYQFHQRNAIARGLKQAGPEDLILVSDVDEIPRPDAIRRFRPPFTLIANTIYFFKFNFKSTRQVPFLSTHMTLGKYFTTAQVLRNKKLYPQWRIDKRPFWDPLLRDNPHVIPNGGWHFSFLMGPEAIYDKIQDYSSKRYRNIPLSQIQRAVERKEDMRGGHIASMKVVPIDESFPRYLQDRRQELEAWIEPYDAPQTLPEQTVNVVCMKWGSVYSSAYVNILRQAVMEHLSLPHRFVCLTDDPEGLEEGIETFPLPNLGIEYGPRGGWAKLGLFQSELYDLRGSTLFLDLDLVILDSLEDFFTFQSGAVTLCYDFMPSPKDLLRAFLDRRTTMGNSSVIGFRIGEQSQVYDRFIRDPQAAFKRFPNEQEFLSHYATKVEFWDRGWCRSFRKDSRYTFQFWRKPKMPPQAKIVVFHGRYKPDPLDHVEWIYNNWHNYLTTASYSDTDISREPRTQDRPA